MTFEPASLPRLQAILDVDVAERAGWTPLALARAFFDGGAKFLQLRAKQLPSAKFLELCDDVVALGQEYGAAVIVNDRVDLARMSGADGVHLGQDDLPPADARTLLGPEAIIGWSTHDTTQIARASNEPVSYIAVGPVFGTRTKETGYAPVGLDLISVAAREVPGRPIVAIGGITLASAPSVWDAGAATVAVIGDLLAGGAPAARVASYNRLAYAAQPSPRASSSHGL